jgi:hypothetical protein
VRRTGGVDCTGCLQRWPCCHPALHPVGRAGGLPDSSPGRGSIHIFCYRFRGKLRLAQQMGARIQGGDRRAAMADPARPVRRVRRASRSWFHHWPSSAERIALAPNPGGSWSSAACAGGAGSQARGHRRTSVMIPLRKPEAPPPAGGLTLFLSAPGTVPCLPPTLLASSLSSQRRRWQSFDISEG